MATCFGRPCDHHQVNFTNRVPATDDSVSDAGDGNADGLSVLCRTLTA
jgi:hypothetical protein